MVNIMNKNVNESTIEVLESSVKIQSEIIESVKRQLAISEEIIELKDEMLEIVEKQLASARKQIFVTTVMWIVLLAVSIIKICM
jgi:uncharacterized coiled-coil protein SlyX